MHPYRTPPTPPRWRLTPSRAALIVAGLLFFVALTVAVRVTWRVWGGG